MPTRRLLSILLLACSACSANALAADSAEPMGCAKESIEVVESHQPMEGPSSWTAVCTDTAGQQKWFCTRAGPSRVICTEDPS